jgi:hypothetical protein
LTGALVGTKALSIAYGVLVRIISGNKSLASKSFSHKEAQKAQKPIQAESAFVFFVPLCG